MGFAEACEWVLLRIREVIRPNADVEWSRGVQAVSHHGFDLAHDTTPVPPSSLSLFPSVDPLSLSFCSP